MTENVAPHDTDPESCQLDLLPFPHSKLTPAEAQQWLKSDHGRYVRAVVEGLGSSHEGTREAFAALLCDLDIAKDACLQAGAPVAGLTEVA